MAARSLVMLLLLLALGMIVASPLAEAHGAGQDPVQGESGPHAVWSWPGWTAIAAIGQVVAALIAIAAAWIAWEVAQDVRRLRIIASATVTPHQPGVGGAMSRVAFNVINDSQQRACVLEGISLVLPGQGDVPLPFEQMNGLPPGPATFPTRMTPGDGIQIAVLGVHFRTFLEGMGVVQACTLRFRFADAIGGHHEGTFQYDPAVLQG